MRIARDIAGRVRRRRSDLLIVLLLFAAGTAVGSLYYRSFIGLEDRQRTPMRPPAVQIDVPVLLACGQGFMSPAERLERLDDFVRMRAPAFACEDLPENLPLREPRSMAYKHLYLLSSIALAWILWGSVSWAALAPLFGIFFGSVISLAYAIFRLGMGRLLAALGSLALLVSPLHLAHLFNLRDYSKAPFILATILILGWMVTRSRSAAALLGASAIVGAVLGFGFGFRADMPIVIPAFVGTLFLFLPGRLFGRLKLKAGALVLFLGCFLLAGWPMIERRASNHRLFHAALVGLTADRLEGIGVTSQLYSLGGDGAQKDRFITNTVNANGLRTHGEQPPSYKQTSAEYYREIARNFPADMLLLAYASTLKVLELPFMNPVDYASLPNTGVFLPDQPFPAGIDSEKIRAFYGLWVRALTSFQGAGLALAIVAVLLVGARDIRLAAFFLFCVLYFGGYPSIQFETRHFFHLEFISLWTLGFVLQRFARLIRSFAALAQRGELPGFSRPSEALRPFWRLVLAPMLALGLVLLGPLLVLRAVQNRHLGNVLAAYSGAKLEPLDLERISENSDTVFIGSPDLKSSFEARGPLHTEYLAADFGSRNCDFSSVEFIVRYKKPKGRRLPTRFGLPLWDLSHRLWVGSLGSSGRTSRVIFPVYHAPSTNVIFGGLELPRAQVGCLEGLSRVDEAASLPLPVGFIVKLPPDWERLPRYKRLADSPGVTHGEERVYTGPPNLVISHGELDRALAQSPMPKLTVHAEIVRLDEHVWKIRGRGEGRFSPLAQIDEIELDRDARLVVQGEVRRGGLVLGLTHQERWDGAFLVVGKDDRRTSGFYEKHQRILDLVRKDDWNTIETSSFEKTTPMRTGELYDRWSVIKITDRGEFVAVFGVPAAGRYSLVLANALSLPRARNDVVIREIGRTGGTAE